MTTYPPPNQKPRVLIVGCGGIGGVLGFHLLDAGVDLTIATTNERVREIWRTIGPSLDGKLATRRIFAERIITRPQDAGRPFDVVFIAVQPTQIDEVGRDLEGMLADNGRVVCLPNGLCEARLASFFGAEKVVGAVVAWGASMKTPGNYTRTSSGGFLVGTTTGASDEQLAGVVSLLEHAGPAIMTKNLRGARFSKLTINCAVTALGTIGGRTLGQLLLRREVRSLALSVMREAVKVAISEGIALEPVARVDLAKLVELDPAGKKLRIAAQHAVLLIVGARYRLLRSSMLAAIERGRKPAIDYINGEIVALGKNAGIPTPFNLAATEVIWAIFRGEVQPGAEALSLVAKKAASSS